MLLLLVGVTSCDNGEGIANGYGNFEADEVVVSAKVPGEIIVFMVNEGMKYKMGTLVGVIDTVPYHLQRSELAANKKALSSKFSGVDAQLVVLKTEKSNLEREQRRLVELVSAGAATSQQLEDIEGKIKVLNGQISSVRTQNPSIHSQIDAIDSKLAQLENTIENCKITIPVSGVILNKIAENHEYTGPGKPLFKIANVSELNLRVYLSPNQIAKIELGQEVIVKIDGQNGEMMDYPGTISWVSSEAEFTPKTIQTKETRVDLVYAVKIRVKNDGALKIGMPAELWL